MEKTEALQHAEQGGDQAANKQEEGLLRWGPWRKLALTGLQRRRPSWNPVGGGSIFPIAPEPDEVHDTEEPEREQRHPRVQKQIALLTKLAKAGEVKKDAHDEAKEWQIYQWRSPSCGEKI